ncbi:MAG: nitrilase-related carbon-nitrogen hydrolase, partial [Nanoarchaeota archaeon]
MEKRKYFYYLPNYALIMGGNTIRIGLVQAQVTDDIDANLEKTAKYIYKASEKGAHIVCLQELFAIKYPGQKEDKSAFSLAEKIPGKTTDFLATQAKENKITLVGGSLFEKDSGGKYYNTSLTFSSSGEIIAKYRKVHIPYDPFYYEKFYFSPGNLGFVQARIKDIIISPLICYDQWYPEAARINALKGSQVIFYPTAIGWSKEMKEKEPSAIKRWQDAMRSHASLNGIYVASVNRVGKEDNLEFWGNSFIADPF